MPGTDAASDSDTHASTNTSGVGIAVDDAVAVAVLPAAHLRLDTSEHRFASYAIMRTSGAGPLATVDRDGSTDGPHGGGRELFDGGGFAAAGYSDEDSNSVASGGARFEHVHSVHPQHGRHSHSGNNAHAMPGAVIAVHAASFSAAVADIRHSVAVAAHCWRLRAAPPVVADAASAAAAADSVPAALRPVSLLFPRQGEELEALNQLKKAALDVRAADADAGAAAADAALSRLTEGLAGVDLGGAGCPSPGTTAARATSRRGAAAGLAAARAPTAEEIARAIALEQAAVCRSFRVMRLLCANNELADDLLETHTADFVKHLFGAFSVRCKGSLYHVCALLQRLIQVRAGEVGAFLARLLLPHSPGHIDADLLSHPPPPPAQLTPVAFIDAVCVDSQRYVGALLPYLHHPPVADTLAQIVCVSHLASAHGGIGPQATLTSSGGGASGMGGMFGGFGGMMGGGFGGLMGGGGFGMDRQPESPFTGHLTLYGQRGVPVPPAARLALWRSLSPWGFLSVLASHVHRIEYAPVRGHATAAADVLLHLVRLAAADQQGDLLLGVLGNTGASAGARGGSAVLRSLAHAACWPQPGADFPAAAPPAPPASLYCSGGEVPERQRESMRVAAELVRVAFQDHVPAPPEGAAVGMGPSPLQQPRLVENRLARSAPAFAAAVVAFLPQLGWALCRVHAALTGGGGGAGGAAHGGSRRGSAVTGGLLGAALGPKKRRVKKKKHASAAAATALTVAVPGAPPAAEGDDDEDDTPAPTSKTDSPGFGAAGSVASRGRSISSATTSMQPLSLDDGGGGGALKAGGSARVSSAGEAGGKGPLPQPQARPYRHPGHDYVAPFGMYRLHAAQLLALLVQVR